MPSKRRLRWAVVPSGSPLPSSSPAARRRSCTATFPASTRTASATNHTEMVIGLWVNSWIVLLAVGVVTWGLMVWAASPTAAARARPACRCSCATTCRSRSSTRSCRSSWCSASSPSRRATRPILETQNDDPDVSIIQRSASVGVGLPVLRRRRDVYRLAMGVQAQTSTRSGDVDEDELPDAVPAGRQDGQDQARSRATSSTRSGSSTSCTRRTCIIGRDNYWSFTPTREGTLRGQVRRALRRVPLAHALQRQGRLRGRVRGLPRTPARSRQRGPAQRRVRPQLATCPATGPARPRARAASIRDDSA